MKTTVQDIREQRLFPRVHCFVDLELQAATNSFCVEALDLSLTGVGLTLPEEVNPFAFSQNSQVSIGLPNFPALEAVVTWSHGRRLGLQFCGTLPEILNSWVGEVLAAQGVLVRDITRVA